jgi:hypothetical protein
VKLYYAGAEVPSWRRLLAAQNIGHVAVSYYGLHRRSARAEHWILADKYPDGQHILLDSGAHSINNSPTTPPEPEIRAVADSYYRFLANNASRIQAFTEFDAVALGQDWLHAIRAEYAPFFGDLYWPVWHAEHGLDALENLAAEHGQVAVTQTTLGQRDLMPVLAAMARSGVKLHAVGMTKPEMLTALRWHSASSTSWVSPAQFGDTIIWTGTELKRYPHKYKAQARKRHRTWLHSNGFDTDLIEADDGPELLRLSLWSWEKLISAINDRLGPETPVNQQPEPSDPPNTETMATAVDRPDTETRNSQTTRPTVVLPGLRLESKTHRHTDEDGQLQQRQIEIVHKDDANMRACDTCFLGEKKCPGFEAGASCKYKIPIELRTKDQISALRKSLLEIQADRALFGVFIEQAEGGYVDPNVSTELDRLFRMIKTDHELDAEGFSLTIQAKQQGQAANAGIISRLFGRDPGEQARALPAPVAVEDVAAQLGIIDAEVVDTVE